MEVVPKQAAAQLAAACVSDLMATEADMMLPWQTDIVLQAFIKVNGRSIKFKLCKHASQPPSQLQHQIRQHIIVGRLAPFPLLRHPQQPLLGGGI